MPRIRRKERCRLTSFALFLAALAGSHGAIGDEPVTSKAVVPAATRARSAAQSAAMERCRKLLKRRDKGRPLSHHGGTRERCFPFKDGFFALTVRVNVSWGSEGFPNSAAIWDIIWVRSGKVQVLDFNASSSVLTNIERGPLAPSSELMDLRQTGDHSYQTDILGVQDLDGDGDAEIFIQKYTEAYEDLDRYDTDILTVRAQKLISYPHSPDAIIDSIDDVDKDGLPDFFTRGAYLHSTMPVCGGFDTEPAVPGVFLLHALPNRGYSESDAVAQKALQEWCPQRPDLPALVAAAVAQKTSKPYSLIDNFPKVVVCARAWGASAEAVMAGINPSCSIAPNGCEDQKKPKSKECPAWVTELAAVAPRVLLK